MTSPFVIVFAGVPGSSKSIIAFYLSETFSMPIFSTDNIRFEVREDLLVTTITVPRALKEFESRQAKRFNRMLTQKKSFIRDGSVDRHWENIKTQIEKAGYKWCMIDMGLSRDFLLTLYTKTGRLEAIDELDIYLEQHNNFIKSYSSDIYVKITDATFIDRNQIAEKSIREFLAEQEAQLPSKLVKKVKES
jgi:hypothetical protein